MTKALLNSAIVLLLIWLLSQVFGWGIINAEFSNMATPCTGEGACWKVIGARWPQLWAGFYPELERWRLGMMLILWIGWLTGFLYPSWPTRIKIFSYIFLLLASFWLIVGDGYFLNIIDTSMWGGMILTLIITVTGCTAAVPIALSLALGRLYAPPSIKWFCIGFIELVRGVPLITVLFMASVMFPLFVPPEIEVDKLLRAIIGVTLFQAAYMAEAFRSGLRAVPIGHIEAAKTLGLNGWHILYNIQLPQMLRYCLAGVTNSIIALFKDTTLVMIIGLYDFLGIAHAAVNDPKWISYILEIYLFVAAVYWICCFTMSKFSKRLERQLRKAYD